MNKIKYDIKYGFFAFFALLIILGSCSSESDRVYFDQPEDFPITILEPVDRDFAEIRNSGVLRVLTYYSSNTYFLHQGIDVGFEYELVREFARENDLALEVIILGPEQSPYDLLNSGLGDVIAANYTITPNRRNYVTFTRPYNLVDQVVVFSQDLNYIPETIEELAEMQIPIAIQRNSSYYERVMELVADGLNLNIRLVSDEMDTESILYQVANGVYEATISDDNMFKAANRYMLGLEEGPVIAEKDTIAWAIRSNSPDLEARMNQFLYQHFRFTANPDRHNRSEFLNVLRQRYFDEGPQLAEFFNPDWHYQNIGIISQYDELVRQVADSLELDWLMLTAMIAQESSFNPTAKSWAGAVGLMQVLPRFSQIGYNELYDPEINVREGARIIAEHLKHYSYMDKENQWAFSLATYNAGMGHVADARRLAIDHNKNPNEWEPVADALLKLMQRRYYQNARHGFTRGIEPVRYVSEIMNRYRTYEAILTLADNQEQRMPGILGIRTLNVP